MNPSKFNISYTKGKELLKRMGLFRMSGVKDLREHGVSDRFKTASFREEYSKVYRIAIENNDYDFLLFDQSFFQFEFVFGKTPSARYSFYQYPREYVSYEEYLSKSIEGLSTEELGYDFEQLILDEYAQFLNEQETIENFVTIRYDLDYAGYRPLIHPVSHLHVGHQTNIRIPIRKIISPLDFVLFVIKNVYYNNWVSIMESQKELINENLEHSIFGESELDKKWSKHEFLELYLA